MSSQSTKAHKTLGLGWLTGLAYEHRYWLVGLNLQALELTTRQYGQRVVWGRAKNGAGLKIYVG